MGIDTAKRDGRYRHYRVEDIDKAEVRSKSFAYPAAFDLRTYATKAFGSYHDDREYCEIVWKFSAAAATGPPDFSSTRARSQNCKPTVR